MIGLIRTQILVALNIGKFFDRRKRVKSIAFLVLIILAMAPSFGMYIYMVYNAFGFLSANNLPMQDLLLSGLYSLAQILTLMIGIPLAYSTLFRSNDLSILLPLPFKPWQILAAKLAAIYVVEMLLSLLFFLPAVIFNVIFTHPSYDIVLNGALSMLLLPVIPLSICALLSLLILSIPGIGRSKWFWHLLIMIAAIGIAVGINVLMVAGTQTDFRDLVQYKMQALRDSGRYMPGSLYAMKTLFVGGIEGVVSQFMSIVSMVCYLAATLMVGEWLYVGPILKGDQVKSRAGRRVEATLVRGFLHSCIRKEASCTFKEPVVAMNSLGGYFAVPLLLLVYTVEKIASKGRIDVIGQFQKGIYSPGFAAHLPLMIVCVGLGFAVLGGMSALFAASYSKDGKRLWLEKSLPVDPFDIFKAKLTMGMIVVSALNLITIALASRFIPIPSWSWIYVFALSETAIAYNASLALLIDCRRPKLVGRFRYNVAS
jgi:ABC-2 type transport system permease protein